MRSILNKLGKVIKMLLISLYYNPTFIILFPFIVISLIYKPWRDILYRRLKSFISELRNKTNRHLTQEWLVLTLLAIIKSFDEYGLLIQKKLATESKRKGIRYWEYLLVMLPGEQRKEATQDLEDIIADLKERRAYKIEIFLMVLMHLMPLIPAFIRGRIPLTAKKKVE